MFGSPASFVAFTFEPVAEAPPAERTIAAAKASFGGREYTVQERLAGVGSTFPAASVARTANV